MRFTDIIKNNSGYSSKTFVSVLSTITSCVGVIAIVGYLTVEGIVNGGIKTDLMGVASVILSLGAFMAAGVYGKIKTDSILYKNEQRDNQT